MTEAMTMHASNDASWQARGLQALRETLDVDARTRRAMIEYLFEAGFWDAQRLSWDAAIARWNDCLNPSKTAFFKLGELWALMRRFDRHHLLLALADELGYELRRKPTEERRQELLERMAETLARTERELADARAALARLDSAKGAAPMPALAAAAPHFALDDDAAGTGGF